jgi:hypothetical protein
MQLLGLAKNNYVFLIIKRTKRQALACLFVCLKKLRISIANGSRIKTYALIYF